MELTRCTAILMVPVAIVFMIGVTILSAKCKNRRIKDGIIPFFLVCLLGGSGVVFSQATWKPCHEGDSVTRAIR